MFSYPETVIGPFHVERLEWLRVGICLSCKSGADVSMGWGPNAVIVVDWNEKETSYSLVLAPVLTNVVLNYQKRR